MAEQAKFVPPLPSHQTHTGSFCRLRSRTIGNIKTDVKNLNDTTIIQNVLERNVNAEGCTEIEQIYRFLGWFVIVLTPYPYDNKIG